ncbi:hypothetical protein [Actinoplanes sp. NPDC026670]|uniref:hypothetical protein n=1 Tax=Actinoplanes sp. NPDC026670 TaxID=3154700 RepID=UPI00340173DF
MLCTHCGGDNPAAFLLCVHCQQPRRITPPASGQTRTIPFQQPPAYQPFQPPPAFQPAVFQSAAHPIHRSSPNFARDATRYMCAAVQLDSALNRRILAGTVEQPLRAIASSPGVDLATVLKYGIHARRRQRITDILLLLFLPFWLFFGLGLLLGWLVVAIERFRTSYRVLAPKLRHAVFDPAQAPEPASDRIRRRIADIAARDRGNVTLYSGYDPFPGFGVRQNEWSFVADISKPAHGEKIRRFSVAEVHDHVAAAVSGLDLPGVTVDDRLFVAGSDLLDDSMPAVASELLPDPLQAPRQQADRSTIRQQWDHPHDQARPYLALRVTGWGGELVMTMFVRFVQYRNEQLYTEADYRLLGPMRADYHSVDDLREHPSLRQVSRIVTAALPAAIIRQLRAPFVVLAEILGPLTLNSERRRIRREITEERTFNYGAPIAPREMAMDDGYHRHFQRADKDQYLRIIERKVLDSLEQFLAAHGIDSSDVRERQSMIINNGLLATGNSQIKAENVAVGINARATAMMSKVAGMGKS